jgi:hypothetical protein
MISSRNHVACMLLVATIFFSSVGALHAEETLIANITNETASNSTATAPEAGPGMGGGITNETANNSTATAPEAGPGMGGGITNETANNSTATAPEAGPGLGGSNSTTPESPGSEGGGTGGQSGSGPQFRLGSTTCYACGPGNFSSAEGSPRCSVCPAGFYSRTAASALCTPCPIFTFNPYTGATLCLPCRSAVRSNFSTCPATIVRRKCPFPLACICRVLHFVFFPGTTPLSLPPPSPAASAVIHDPATVK